VNAAVIGRAASSAPAPSLPSARYLPTHPWIWGRRPGAPGDYRERETNLVKVAAHYGGRAVPYYLNHLQLMAER